MSSLKERLRSALFGLGDVAQHAARVQACYSYYEHLSNVIGRSDYTDGMYFGVRETGYDRAQAQQIDYLLDEAGVASGTTLLDLGCGRGRLLEAAGDRGARAVGITISPEQVAYCRARGLDTQLLDYKDIDASWDARFDAVIANGSLEHFVSAGEGMARQANAVYRRLFELMHAVVRPGGRLIITAIHHRARHGTRFDAPMAHKLMFGMLNKVYGGWYPLHGQLEHCATGRFELVREEDGTQDYLWTCEDAFRGWLWKLAPTSVDQTRRVLGLARSVVQQGALAPLYVVNPYLWTWQFRGDPPPVRLLRQTWKRVDA